jgi:hypothetical protein
MVLCIAVAQVIERDEKALEIIAQELLAELGVVARACKIGVAYGSKTARLTCLAGRHAGVSSKNNLSLRYGRKAIEKA